MYPFYVVLCGTMKVNDFYDFILQQSHWNPFSPNMFICDARVLLAVMVIFVRLSPVTHLRQSAELIRTW